VKATITQSMVVIEKILALGSGRLSGSSTFH
jgi:hypothetical protein